MKPKSEFQRYLDELLVICGKLAESIEIEIKIRKARKIPENKQKRLK
jgi:hypothetical protein